MLAKTLEKNKAHHVALFATSKFMRIFCIFIGILILFAKQNAFAAKTDEVCFTLYQKAGAIPLTKSCPLDCTLADVGMGNYYCTANGGGYIQRYCADICYIGVRAIYLFINRQS